MMAAPEQVAVKKLSTQSGGERTVIVGDLSAFVHSAWLFNIPIDPVRPS